MTILCSAHPGRVCLAVSAVALLMSSPVTGQQQRWIHQFGGFQDQIAYSVLMSDRGGVWISGSASGAYLGPSFGQEDAFVARFDARGVFLWGIKFGTIAFDAAGRLAPADDAGVFVAGVTNGSLGAPAAGGLDPWLARCDALGNRLWMRQFGTAGSETGGICVDGAGGVFFVGTTNGSLAAPNVGANDIWLARYDGIGSQLWIRQFGTTGNDSLLSMTSDIGGGFYACGVTGGSLFGPQAGIADAWVARFDAEGTLLWGRQFGTSMPDVSRGISIDGAGGFFVVGTTGGDLAGPNLGPYDIFIARYDALGNQRGIAQFGTIANDWPDAVCADGFGGAFVAGTTNGSFGAPNAGLADAWIARVDSMLNVTWVRQLGSPFHDSAFALAHAGPGRAYVCGYTNGNIITGSGGGGGADAWVALYETCVPDCDGDGFLTLADFACFQAKFIASDPYADCNADGQHTIADFGCFQTKFVQGCP